MISRDSRKLAKMHLSGTETMKKLLPPLDFFEQLRWALAPDSIDEHAIQILSGPICQDSNVSGKLKTCIDLLHYILQYKNIKRLIGAAAVQFPSSI